MERKTKLKIQNCGSTSNLLSSVIGYIMRIMRWTLCFVYDSFQHMLEQELVGIRWPCRWCWPVNAPFVCVVFLLATWRGISTHTFGSIYYYHVGALRNWGGGTSFQWCCRLKTFLRFVSSTSFETTWALQNVTGPGSHGTYTLCREFAPQDTCKLSAGKIFECAKIIWKLYQTYIYISL